MWKSWLLLYKNDNNDKLNYQNVFIEKKIIEVPFIIYVAFTRNNKYLL